MFSANPSISPTGFKPSDVANGVGLGGNGVELAKNGVELRGTESDWGGTRLDWGGTGSDWGVGRGYKRRDQLIWPHSLPLIAPKPPASN